VNEPLRIRHLGRTSRACVPADAAALQRLSQALQRDHHFTVVAERDGGLELRRRAFVLQDDWPVRVSVRASDGGYRIDYGLFIPWSWIAALGLLALVVLPFAGIPHAALAAALAALAVALASLCQRFDCRPDARFWQQRPRRRWHETMQRLLREAFG
jgi:hypothetical protein